MNIYINHFHFFITILQSIWRISILPMNKLTKNSVLNRYNLNAPTKNAKKSLLTLPEKTKRSCFRFMSLLTNLNLLTEFCERRF